VRLWKQDGTCQCRHHDRGTAGCAESNQTARPADAFAIGDLAMLIFELPALLVLGWYRRGSAIAVAVLTWMLGFFTHDYVSMVFGTAQTGSFRSMLQPQALLGSRSLGLDVNDIAAAVPAPPRRNASRRISSRWRQRSRWPGCQE
jgi:hypothetical protein